MPDPGRTTDPRNVPAVTLTSGSPNFTAPAGSFDPAGDPGRTISGTGIPAGATVSTVNAAGSGGTLSANATASGAVTVALGAGNPGSLGFRGWSPETPAEAGVLTVGAKNAGATDHNRPVAGTPLTVGRRSRY